MFQIFEDEDHYIEESVYLSKPAQILADPNLVVCIEDQLYSYTDSMQILVAQLAYG